jgi:hypothetical protein
MSKNACKGLQYFDLHFGVSTVSAYNEIVRSFHTQLHRAIHFFYVVTKQFTINYFYIWEISSTPSFIQTQITILEIWFSTPPFGFPYNQLELFFNSR